MLLLRTHWLSLRAARKSVGSDKNQGNFFSLKIEGNKKEKEKKERKRGTDFQAHS